MQMRPCTCKCHPTCANAALFVQMQPCACKFHPTRANGVPEEQRGPCTRRWHRAQGSALAARAAPCPCSCLLSYATVHMQIPSHARAELCSKRGRADAAPERVVVLIPPPSTPGLAPPAPQNHSGRHEPLASLFYLFTSLPPMPPPNLLNKPSLRFPINPAANFGAGEGGDPNSIGLGGRGAGKGDTPSWQGVGVTSARGLAEVSPPPEPWPPLALGLPSSGRALRYV